jgi:hypothetical protein
MHDYEIKEPFPFDKGANIEFIDWHDGKEVYKAVTLPDPKRSVRWNISTYRDLCYGAVHWYGTLKVYPLYVRLIEVYDEERKYHKAGDEFSTNFLTETMEKCPDLKWTYGWDIDITYEREDDEVTRYNRDPYFLEKKGDHSNRFVDFSLLKRRMEQEFNRLFKPPWRLGHGCTVEEGIEILRQYKREDC